MVKLNENEMEIIAKHTDVLELFKIYNKRFSESEIDLCNCREKIDKLKKKGDIYYLTKRKKFRFGYEHSMTILYQIERSLVSLNSTIGEKQITFDEARDELELCCVSLENNVRKIENILIELKYEEPKKIHRYKKKE